MREGDRGGSGNIGGNLLLALVLGTLIALHWLILPDPSRRNLEFLPDMVESGSLSSFEPTAPLTTSHSKQAPISK